MNKIDDTKTGASANTCATRRSILISNSGITFRASKPGLHRLKFDDIDDSPVRREMQGWLWCAGSELAECMTNCWNASKEFVPSDIITDFALLNGRFGGRAYVVAIEISEIGFTIHNNHFGEMLPLQGGELWIPARWAANILSAQKLFPSLRGVRVRRANADPEREEFEMFGPNGGYGYMPKKLSPIIRALKEIGTRVEL